MNALSNLKVTPEGMATVQITDSDVAINFKGVAFTEVVENGVLTQYLVAKRTGPA